MEMALVGVEAMTGFISIKCLETTLCNTDEIANQGDVFKP